MQRCPDLKRYTFHYCCIYAFVHYTTIHLRSQGVKHFNIIPTTFVLPDELPQFRGQWAVHATVLYLLSGIQNPTNIVHYPIWCPYFDRLKIACSLGKKRCPFQRCVPVYYLLNFYEIFCLVHFRKKRGTWIVKPVSLSRGRGITIINHVSKIINPCPCLSFALIPSLSLSQPNQAKSDEPMVVSQYIERPLIVNGM